ncbi:hypothetical protein [Desulfococcus multivorans]|uniref:Uncharacterized protein n=1 Tax=Desulfococcus multivorans DSM 2059 TaxID=1121405 RepID=S7U566_DESML|nr:hypothetical protein [Desulfococcus multivorans]AOY58760.1 uncharacterized protein Dmul_19870 [Desulfococcus multivorans]AQV01044.1 hypothetical protein B2D07_09860 [Desulfococcus multivorans]EPR44437.1 hypothetical protein dsmv_3807 [Desulfococcus multivorans DSM 2059]SJZ49604.1 hypothetical protein SAMN02745446_00682 [Desulfococcus multivorans DSM 2059]
MLTQMKPARTVLFCLFIFLAAGQAYGARQEPGDLRGLWQVQDRPESVVRITQTGGSITGVWASVSPESQTGYGFKPGDWFLRASWGGASWQGEIHTRFRLLYKTLCPHTWDRAAEVDLKPGPDGDTLEGHYQGSDIKGDCVIRKGALKPVTLRRIRQGLELSGYWRVTSGKAAGWMMYGRTFAGGRVALDTAPGVVIGTTWSRSGTDLLTSRSGPAPFKGELDGRVTPPGILTALRNATVSVDRQGRILTGKPSPGELAEEGALQLRRENWRVEILKDRTHYGFNPGSRERPGLRSRGLEGGPTARIVFERRDTPFHMIPGEVVTARLRVIDPAGNILRETFADRRPTPRSQGLTLEIANRSLYGLGTWNGLQDEATQTSFPAGAYTLELVVRDGMAEQTLTHRVSLGQGLQITGVTEYFAPEYEDAAIDFLWIPNDTEPEKVVLEVYGGADGAELILSREVSPRLMLSAGGQVRLQPVSAPRSGEGNWRVYWNGTDDRNAPVNWTALIPFRIVLRVLGKDGDWHTAEAAVTVKIVDLKIIPRELPRLSGEEAGWYAEHEMPADANVGDNPDEVGLLPVYAKLIIRDAGDNRRAAKRAVDVDWSYTFSPGDSRDRPRSPGFYPPGRGISETPLNRVTIPLIYDTDAKEGRSRVRYQMPARAEGQNELTRQRIPADRFKIHAHLTNLPEIQKESAEYVIGPGKPARIRQIFPDEIRDRFHISEDRDPEDRDRLVSNNFEFEYLDDVSEYIDTVATYAVRWGTVGLDLTPPMPVTWLLQKALIEIRDAAEDWSREERKYPTRYLGIVNDVPFRGFWGEEQRPVPVFLAGYAGEDHARLKGGQAFLVMFEVSDRYGNKIPVTGKKARRIHTMVNDKAGLVPPFVLASDSGDNQFRYGAPKNYSPFGPATAVTPPGVHAFYYVAGIRGFSKTLSTDLESLQTELQKYGEQFLKPPSLGNTDEIDSRLNIFAEIDGKAYAQKNDIRLIRPGSFSAQPGELEKWVKWMVFAEVHDKETFMLDLKFGMIPFAGDLREILVYHLKSYLDRELGILDEIAYYLSGIGLLADFGYLLPPAGLSLNAFLVSAKAQIKLIRPGTKAARGFGEFLAPLKSAVKTALNDPRNADNLSKVVSEITHISNLVGVAEDAVKKGGVSLLHERMRKLARYLDHPVCNPDGCLWELNRLPPRQIGKTLDEIPDALDEIYGIATQSFQGRKLTDDEFADIVSFLLEIKTDKGLSSRTVANIADLLSLLEDPLTTLQKLHRIQAGRLRRAAAFFNDRIFKKAVEGDPRVFPTFVGALAEHGDEGRLFFETWSRNAEGYQDVATLVRNTVKTRDSPRDMMKELIKISGILNDAVPTLITIVKHERFAGKGVRQGLGGSDGLKALLSVIAGVTRADVTQSAAEETLRIAELLTRVGPPASGRYIQLLDIGRVFDNLGAVRYNMYMEAVKFFRRNGSYVPGILEQASIGSTRNILLVAGSKRNALNYALEIVGTHWLVRKGIRIQISAGQTVPGALRELPAIRKIDIEAFGWKHQRSIDPQGTLEADVELNIPEIAGNFVIDWKNYGFSGKPEPSDIAKAVEALKNRAVENVIFLSPRIWSPDAAKQISDAAKAANLNGGLLLGQVIGEGELALFLRVVE